MRLRYHPSPCLTPTDTIRLCSTVPTPADSPSPHLARGGNPAQMVTRSHRNRPAAGPCVPFPGTVPCIRNPFPGIVPWNRTRPLEHLYSYPVITRNRLLEPPRPYPSHGILRIRTLEPSLSVISLLEPPVAVHDRTEPSLARSRTGPARSGSWVGRRSVGAPGCCRVGDNASLKPYTPVKSGDSAPLLPALFCYESYTGVPGARSRPAGSPCANCNRACNHRLNCRQE